MTQHTRHVWKKKGTVSIPTKTFQSDSSSVVLEWYLLGVENPFELQPLVPFTVFPKISDKHSRHFYIVHWQATQSEIIGWMKAK